MELRQNIKCGLIPEDWTEELCFRLKELRRIVNVSVTSVHMQNIVESFLLVELISFCVAFSRTKAGGGGWGWGGGVGREREKKLNQFTHG